MSTAIDVADMSLSEFLQLPENDGVDRILFRGQLREKPMTVRNRVHARITMSVGYYLKGWLLQQPEPRGEIVGGEVGCVLRQDPGTAVGIDVAYISAEVLANQSGRSRLIEGPPVLAVEVLSPSDRQQDIDEKVEEYLECGVSIVWVINPQLKHVTVYRPDQHPILYAGDAILTAEPELPDFSVPVAKLFE